MIISANTKISVILKAHPEALEAIIELSPKFNKLRNPLLRKLIASRTSVGMAGKIGGCMPKDFFDKLEPLGFEINWDEELIPTEQAEARPDFMKNLSSENTVELDVRDLLESGKDPLNLILEKLKTVKAGQVFKLTASFEPVPLIILLGKKGFESHVETINYDLVISYFYKNDSVLGFEEEKEAKGETGWEETVKCFEGRMQTLDVRALEMPLPMMTILETLDELPLGLALFVYHKRIPVFLLPELKDRGFDFRTKEISEAEVHMIIFRT